MNNTVKRKIARGVRKAAQRRRMSEAMKASWVRRRNSSNVPTTLTHVYTDDDLLEVAITLIGRENVRTLLVNAIKGVLL